MPKNYYDILGVTKSASDEEIKKAYKKMTMQHHPDRNKWDTKAEAKFKEINEAYQTLGDTKKKANYDQFGSAEGQPWFGWGQGGFSGFQWQSRQAQDFGGFEDIFSQFGGARRGSSESVEFDMGDIFGNMGSWGRPKKQRDAYEEMKTEEMKPNLDVTETIEIPFLDFLYDTTINVRTVYNKHLTLKVKAGTKPGTKYKISGKWRTSEWKTGDMYVIVDAKMPKEIPQSLKPMVDALKSQL